ncbi:MAG: hypothetical protein ACRELC_06240, partial [Gemmatimonadota bacterium]
LSCPASEPAPAAAEPVPAPAAGTPCLVDARARAEVRHGPGGTYHGFAVSDAPGRGIDYVLASAGTEFLRSGHLSTSEAGYHPSDHLPVLAELRLPR